MAECGQWLQLEKVEARPVEQRSDGGDSTPNPIAREPLAFISTRLSRGIITARQAQFRGISDDVAELSERHALLKSYRK